MQPQTAKPAAHRRSTWGRHTQSTAGNWQAQLRRAAPRRAARSLFRALGLLRRAAYKYRLPPPPLGRSLPLGRYSHPQRTSAKPPPCLLYAHREEESERRKIRRRGTDPRASSIVMRPIRAGAHLAFWRTPTPYLLLGFALMMGIIAVALLVLVCTDSKPSGSSRRGSAGEDASARGMAPLDREPKVVVIMAGDDMPSFLASARPFAFPAVDADADEPRNADAW